MSNNKIGDFIWGFGIIHRVDPHPAKPLWAEIKVPEMDDVIQVHIEELMEIHGGADGPQIGGKSSKIPKPGDEVAFIPELGNFHIFTQTWVLKADYDAAILASPPVHYRCIIARRLAGTKVFKTEQLYWQGSVSKIREFAEESITSYLETPNHDYNMKTLKYTLVVRWEVSTDGGHTWRICLCPDEYERIVTSMRDL